MSTNDSIIPSRHNRDISKCVRCKINEMKVKTNIIWYNDKSVID